MREDGRAATPLREGGVEAAAPPSLPRMRTLPLVMGLLLATALVTFAPTSAASEKCIDTPAADVCVPDRCTFQSDCCPATGFWCPEDG